jgi:[protein-PII] uridylyltransferase
MSFSKHSINPFTAQASRQRPGRRHFRDFPMKQKTTTNAATDSLRKRQVADYRFGLDFSTVGTPPEDAKLRNGYFSAFKELIRREREKIRAWHRSGAGGREVVQAHTGLADEIIRRIIASLGALPAYSANALTNEFALVAVGGYGRGELNPHSDIDLLFILKDRTHPATNTFIQDAISVFWGVGLEIGQSCRTIRDTLNLADQDITIKTALIETRLLTGDANLAREFFAAVEKNIHKKKINEFLNSSLKEKYNRFGAHGGVVSHPEPDIKNGPGGLRDYHVALWAVAIRFGHLSFRELGRDDVISETELDLLERAVDFSLRVRNELHFLAGKKYDVLNLDLQKELADHLGYRLPNGSQPVEQFMRDYFLNATHIHNYCGQIFERCLKTQPSMRAVISNFVRKDLGNGFCIADSQLARKDGGGALAGNPGLLLDAFLLAKDHGLDLDADLRREMRRHNQLIDAEYLKQPRARDALFAVLEHPRAEHILRLMHDVGVLGRILPEFGVTLCGVHYDFYHRYTTDEHSLRMIRFLEDLAGAENDDTKDLSTIYKETADKIPLKLACLLHSMGKSATANPDAVRPPLAEVAERLGLAPEQAGHLAFLTDNLYEMMETAFHQDIHQPAVIEEFAQKVATPERLKLLYLISYAELKAVAPDTWTAWKKILLAEMYARTRNYFERPESLLEQPQLARLELYEILEGECDLKDIEQHLQQMPEDYLVTVYADEAALHLRLIRSLTADGKLFSSHHSFNEAGGFHNVVVCCRADALAFKKTVGTLTARNLNILGAQIYLRRDGFIIVTTQVEGMEHMDLQDPSAWEEVESALGDVLEDRKKLPDLLRARTRYVKEIAKSQPIMPGIHFELAAVSPHTVLRIEARDHPGMLYKIAKALSDFDIQVHRAKISCKGGRGIDVFYISETGKKITFEPFQLKIKEHLVNTLLVERLEDLGE